MNIALYGAGLSSDHVIGHRIATLSECISCEITKTIDYQDELVLQYPIQNEIGKSRSSEFYDGLTFNNGEFIKVKSINNPYPDGWEDKIEDQYYKIYKIKEDITNGIITVNAYHISYILSGYPIDNVIIDYPTLPSSPIESILSGSAIPIPDICQSYIYGSQSEVQTEYKLSNIRESLIGDKTSISALTGCEIFFDNLKISLFSTIGKDRGYKIKYGVNLVGLTNESDDSKMFTGVYPYVLTKGTQGQPDSYLTLPEKILYKNENYPDNKRIMTKDFSDQFESGESISEDQLRNAAKEFLQNPKFFEPTIEIKASFAELSKSEEYKNYYFLERVEVGDIVTVEYPNINTELRPNILREKARVKKVVFDVLKDRYKSVIIGTVKNDVTDTIYKLTKQN